MREWINIAEQFNGVLSEQVVHSSITDDGSRFTVICDPSPKQFATMLNNARYKRLRMLCRDGHIYCWDSYYADHDMVGHGILGYTGGPSDIGIRIEATSDILEYGEVVRVDWDNPDERLSYGALKELAREKSAKYISKLLADYPRLKKYLPNNNVLIPCDIHKMGSYDHNTHVKVGPLDSFEI